MTKKYCDCCGKEIQETARVFEFAKHITEAKGIGGYAFVNDGETIPTSGINIPFDLCLNCYNDFMYGMWEHFQTKKTMNNI